MKRLSLFVFTPTYAYSFGCVVVAAHDLLEAEEIIKNADIRLGLTFESILEGVSATGKSRIVIDNAGEE